MFESPVITYEKQLEIGSHFLIESIKTKTSSANIQYLHGSKIKSTKPYPRAHLLKTAQHYLVIKNVKVMLLETERLLKFDEIQQKKLGLIFIDCHLPPTAVNDSSFAGIVFYNTEVSGSFNVDRSNVGDFLLDNCSVINIKLNHSTLSKIRLGHVITKNIEFTNCCSLEFEMDKVTTGYIRLINSTMESLKSNNCEHGYILFSSNTQVGFIELVNTSARALETNGITAGICLANAQIPFVEINDCTISILELKTGTKSEINLSSCSINLLKLERVVITKETTFNALSCVFVTISVAETYNAGQLLFKNISVIPRRLNWKTPGSIGAGKKVRNSERKHLDYVKEERLQVILKIKMLYEQYCKAQDEQYGVTGCIRLISSSMGKTEIIGSDLTSTTIEYKNTNLLDMFVAGTLLPKQVTISDFETDSVDYYHQRIDYFSQIRKIYEKQGDIIKSLSYGSEMMDNQQKFFSVQLKSQNIWKRCFSQKSLLHYTLYLNNISNHHGNSWLRALCFLLVSSAILFTPSVWSMKYDLDLNYLFKASGYSFFNDVNILQENLKYYFAFLNPARPFDYIPKQQTFQMANFYFFWDLLSRIISGFGVYQFIVAFRRPGKI